MPLISNIKHQLENLSYDDIRQSADVIIRDPRTWVAVVGTVTIYKLVQFYWDRRNYPPGPFPLPLLGNVLLFKKKAHMYQVMVEAGKPFGSVYTMFLGNKPSVVITDLDAAQEAFRDRKNDFSGRPWFDLTKVIIGEKGTDVVFADFGREWEVLRRVAFAAVRKYAVHEQLPTLIAGVVDEVVDTIVKDNGSNPFDIDDYLYLMTFNILAQISYGQKYSIADEEFLQLVEDNRTFNDQVQKLMVGEVVPPMRFVYRKIYQAANENQTRFRNSIKSKYQNHLRTYEPDVVRNFCDCLISAKLEAEAENRESAELLNDDNLGLTLLDLFLAGSDTSRNTLYWIILFLANFPNVQQKCRDEINNVVGVDEVIGHEHKARLNYVQAFVSEALRRCVVFIVDSSIAGHSIPKGTMVNMLTYAILHDPKHWDKPEEFLPERFLDKNGKHNSRVPAFVGFGIGRRACLGEKLAVVDLELITCRLLQATHGYQIALPGGPGSVSLYGDINFAQVLQAEKYKIILKLVN